MKNINRYNDNSYLEVTINFFHVESMMKWLIELADCLTNTIHTYLRLQMVDLEE